MFMKNRKSLSGVIVTCLIVALTTAAAAQSDERSQTQRTAAQSEERSQSPRKTMEGSWRVICTPGQSPIPLPPTFESIVTYIPGGGLVESDNLAVPGSIAGTGQGAWESRGARQFSFTFTKYVFSTQGQSLGSGRITEKIILDSGGNEYTGEGTLEILNPAGSVLFAVPLTTHAVRMRAEE
jgi:hypothetical protein